MIYIGIDAGRKGGAVAISSDQEILSSYVFQFISLESLEVLDSLSFCEWLSQFTGEVTIAIESILSVPQGNRAMSIFNQGRNWEGVIQAVLRLFPKEKISLIPSTSWQRQPGVKLKGKMKYREELIRLGKGEQLTSLGRRVPHEGLVDAFFIARFLVTGGEVKKKAPSTSKERKYKKLRYL